MIDKSDFHKQDRIYVRTPSGSLWRIAGYISCPSITLENLSDGRREHIGIYGSSMEDFYPVPMLCYSHSDGKIILEDGHNS